MAGVTLAEIELFFVDEAALLDEWRLEEWLALFAEDGRYLVPSLDQPHSDHRTALFLIADDRKTLASRVRQVHRQRPAVACPQLLQLLTPPLAQRLVAEHPLGE